MTTLPTPRYLALKAAMMPRDTNQHGTIFGGVLLSYIDQAASIGARAVIQERGWPDNAMVTVAMDRIEFKEPVLVGDTVSFWTTVTRIGRTSITADVQVEVERSRATIPVTEAEVTYVAVQVREGKRHPVPLRGEQAEV